MGSGGIWILGVARSRLVVRRVRWWGRAALAVAPFFFVFLRFHDALFCFPACVMPFLFFMMPFVCFCFRISMMPFFTHVLAHGVCANHKNKNGDNRNGPITTHADISNNVNIL